MKYHIMRHFIRICTVCKYKIDIQRKKCHNVLEIITCNPSVYKMDHPDFIVCGLMENPIGLKRVNILYIQKFRDDFIFSKSVKRHICNFKNLRLGHDLPIPINVRLISLFCESFIFMKLGTCAKFREINPRKNFRTYSKWLGIRSCSTSLKNAHRL